MGALTQGVLRLLSGQLLRCRRGQRPWLAIGFLACLSGPSVATDAMHVEQSELAPLAETVAPFKALAVGSFEASLSLALQGYASASVHEFRGPGDQDDLIGAHAFYMANGYAPLWVSNKGYNAKALRLLSELQNGDAWGLKARDFLVPAVRQPIGNPSLVDAELALTRAVLRYARHARGGRIADPGAELSGFIDRKPQLLPVGTVLARLAAAEAPDAALRALHPQHAAFERLRLAYNLARDQAKSSAAKILPAGPLLKLDVSHPNVAILRLRLNVPVQPASAEDPSPSAELYDEAVAAAVKTFQTQAQMRYADGVVGEKTRNALNAQSVSTSPAMLLANMEQWRWMPDELGNTHIAVNIPEFTTRVMRDGKAVHTERVVTGKIATATPLFSDKMQTIVFQPKWGVPDSIKVNELLPQLQEGNGLKAGLKMSLGGRDVDPWDVDWSKADILNYHVYQPAGDDNALGVVKFLFPNKHAVYMHDTPSKKLFNAQVRTFSHGCIRVRNPLSLAEHLLAADKGWTSTQIKELAWDGPENVAVKLDTHVPVHITYFTALVDDAGKVETFNDVYGHERRITLALEGNHKLISKLDPAPLPKTNAAPLQVATATGRPGSQYPVARPAVAPVAVAIARAAERSAARFTAPQALGFPQSAKKWSWAPQPSNRRYQGNTTNDVIMRQLGNN